MELGVQAPCLLDLVHRPTMALATVPSRSPILTPPQKHGVSFLPPLGCILAVRLQVEHIPSVLDLNTMDKHR